MKADASCRMTCQSEVFDPSGMVFMFAMKKKPIPCVSKDIPLTFSYTLPCSFSNRQTSDDPVKDLIL